MDTVQDNASKTHVCQSPWDSKALRRWPLSQQSIHLRKPVQRASTHMHRKGPLTATLQEYSLCPHSLPSLFPPPPPITPLPSPHASPPRKPSARGPGHPLRASVAPVQCSHEEQRLDQAGGVCAHEARSSVWSPGALIPAPGPAVTFMTLTFTRCSRVKWGICIHLPNIEMSGCIGSRSGTHLDLPL